MPLTPSNAFPNLAFPQHGFVAWNPAKGTGGGFLNYSNANLTAFANTGADSYVYSTEVGTKFYFEIVADNVRNSLGIGIGVCDSSFTNAATFLGVDTHGIAIYPDGTDRYNNVNTNIGTTFTTGDVVSVAIDIGNSLIWWRVNGGNWNNSGPANPATGVGGVSTGAISSPVFAAVDLRGGVTNGQVTARFALGSFSFSVPAGFSTLKFVSTVQSFTYPGAVWPLATGPAVLSYTNAFPNLAFPQHLTGQTTTVQNFLYPGAVQPQAVLIAHFAIQYRFSQAINFTD